MQVLSAYALNLKPGFAPVCAVVEMAAGSALGKDGTSSWIHVAMASDWEGHPAGEIHFNAESFGQILDNFRKCKTPVGCDYEHQSFDSSAGPKPASGYVRDLELRADGSELWALVEWTPRAAELIRAGEYRFCSPVVAFESRDRKSGKPCGAELLSIALTNNPFLDGQQPIRLTALAARVAPTGAKEMSTAAAPAEDKKPEDEKPVEMAEQVAAEGDAPKPDEGGDKSESADANALLDMVAEAAGVDKATAIAALMDKLEDVVAVAKKAAEKDGTAAEMTAAPAEDTKALAMSVRLDHLEAGFAAMKAERDALLAEKSSGEKAKADAEAEAKAARVVAMVDERIAGGYILDASREQAIKLFAADEAAAAAMFSHKVVPTGEATQAGNEGDKSKAAGAATALDTNTMGVDERAMFACFRGAGDSKERAAQRVLQMRARKGVN